MENVHDSLVSVSLDQLRAFDLNPRITRNPDYDEIKESIRNRGLDHPPQITRRPNESFYIIASGGNTRLAILNELWLETQDKKYWNIVCYYRQWRAEQSIDEGNLDCLLGHLVENDKRGSLTFIERALGVQNAVDLYQKINRVGSQKELVEMLCQAGYPVSSTQISIMSTTIAFLLPYIPEALYSGLSRRIIDKLLALRSNTEKFWNNFCRESPVMKEYQPHLFDDIFSTALMAFNGPAAGFSLEHIQDELTGLISQALQTDYNTVALVTDARAQKRNNLLGTEPAPDLPEISEQRCVEFKNRDKTAGTKQQAENNDCTDTRADNALSGGTEYEPDGNDSTDNPEAQTQQLSSHGDLPGALLSRMPVTGEPLLYSNPEYDTPETLASLIDHTAWELASSAGLEFLISSTETGVFDIASPENELSNEEKIYWQMLSFLAGKISGSAIIWRQMLTGTPETPAGFNEETLIKVFKLICSIRRLYEKQYKGDIS